jgi:hypothetical protein
MNDSNFFNWLGNAVGSLIRIIVGVLQNVLGRFGTAIREFSTSLAHAIGMSPSTFNFALLILGLIFLFAAVGAFVRRSIFGGIIWLILAVLVLGGLTG